MALPQRVWGGPATLILIALTLVATACSSASPNDDTRVGDDDIVLADRPRQYVAEWLINASAIDPEGPVSFVYRELVDDTTGRYLVQSPQHIATQSPDSVSFCAAIFRVDSEPFCASSPRAEGTPNVLSYPIQILSDWGPRALYDLAGHREVSLVANSDVAAWERRIDENLSGVSVECFTVVGETSAAETGFEVCFTNDDLHLVASVDLQSDFVFEIALVVYERSVGEDDFLTGFEEITEARPALQEQLLALYPEVPAPRPTPTPAPDEAS